MAEEKEYRTLLEERLELGQELLARCEKLSNCVEGLQKLARKIKAEIKFLESLQSTNTPMNTSHVKSTNLTHLDGVLKTAEQTEGVVALFKTFHFIAVNHSSEAEVTCIVDAVASNGCTWIKVIARNPNALHKIWEGQGQYGARSLEEQAKEFLECSQQHKINFTLPLVVFSFYSGVTEGIARSLVEAGVTIWGQIIANPGKELDPSVLETTNDRTQMKGLDNSYINHLNLDVSTMIAYVSAVTNGHAMLVFQDAILTAQAEKERKDPLLPKLMEYFEGKILYACCSAVEDFTTIVKTIGGKNENYRASQLLNRIIVVEDEPSERALHLANSASVKPRSKIVFGTGDAIKAITVTANASFVRGARSQGEDFSVFLHDSRALTESKEDKATPLTASS